MVMPMMVERGMVRSGSFTSPAGTVADSKSKIGKHRQRCQGCRGSQQGLAAGVELTEMRRIDVEQTNDRDRPERYHFRIGHKLGKEAGGLDAAQIDEHHSPDGPQRQHRRHDPAVQAGKHVDDGAGKRHRNNRE